MSQRKVLVIGGGGREHALAWKLARSSRIDEVLVAPGNAGTAAEPDVRNVAVAADDINGLLQLAQDEAPMFTVVGPEAPLVAGLVDRFAAAGLRCFGPRAIPAQLEGSKAFAKDFMARHGIPTARHAVFREIEPALAHVRKQGAPIVIKADGLAGGKGVIVAQTVAEAEQAVRDMLGSRAFGEASREIVIEAFLEGEEASFIVLADGKHALPLASSQDHKRRDAGDIGPNTGGMGAISPAPCVDADVEQRIMARVIQPVLDGMAADGTPFIGFLYAGLMIDAAGNPHVVEFNVRMGDPETQPLLLRLESDLADLIEAALDRELDAATTHWDPRAALGVVLCSGGYPGRVRKGLPIAGLERAEAPHVKVFHAGTRLADDGQVVTAGGRVLCVCALDETLAGAKHKAYEAASEISFEGAFCRGDIGHHAL